MVSHLRYAAHSSGVKADVTGSALSHAGGDPAPVCAAALDHGNESARSASRARTGFRSTYRRAAQRWARSKAQEGGKPGTVTVAPGSLSAVTAVVS
jgi:hypothetical protein